MSLFDTALSQLSYVGAWHLSRGYEPERQPDSSHPSQLPSQVLPTADGWLVVFCAKEKFFRNLVEILGSPEMADDSRFNSFATRLENCDVLSDTLKGLTRGRSTKAWLSELRGRVPCAPVNTVGEAFLDSLVAEDEMVWELPHPEFGVVKVVGNPIKFSGDEPPKRRGPSLGEHNDEILGDLTGLSRLEIEELRSDKVI